MLFPDEVNLKVPPIVDGEGNILDMGEIIEVGDPETGATDPRLARMMRSLNHRLDNLKSVLEREKGVDDSLLNILDDGKKMSLAAELATSRFVRAYGHDPSIPWNRTKTEMAAENIAAELERYERERGTVLVFADQGVGGAKAGTARKPREGPGLVIPEEISWGDLQPLPGPQAAPGPGLCGAGVRDLLHEGRQDHCGTPGHHRPLQRR